MRVLVIGTSGQLATAIRECASNYPEVSLCFLGRPQCDMATPGSVASAILGREADVIINAAAYTAVDRAESEPDLALRINGAAAGEAAAAAKQIGAHFVQISTDYVFDGEGRIPYREDDPTAPINAYGRSKLAGEELVRAANADHIIVRTSWVFSAFGGNFVKTMLGLASERQEVRVVGDQLGCPTSAHDLAETLLGTIAQAREWGATYHVASPEPCSWADLAAAIFTVSHELGGPHAEVIPIPTRDYPTPAPRPAYSVLDSGRFAAKFGTDLQSFRSALFPVIERLVSASAQIGRTRLHGPN